MSLKHYDSNEWIPFKAILSCLLSFENTRKQIHFELGLIIKDARKKRRDP